jgi:DNA-binding NarL/FixJ family response regulator
VEVTGEVDHAKELPSRIKATESDLVLLSWELPGLVKFGSLPALREACPDILVIALSGRSEARRAALEAGADAFVSKTDPPERLLATIADCESDRFETHEVPTFQREEKKLDDK